MILKGKQSRPFYCRKRKLLEIIDENAILLLKGYLEIARAWMEGWSLAECFSIRCIVAAPYVVPYSAPATFERQFQRELPLLYKYLIEAPSGKVCWKDVIHWMWPLFTENWGKWRDEDLHLSPCPFTDPVTGIPTWYDRPQSPLLIILAIKSAGLWFLVPSY